MRPILTATAALVAGLVIWRIDSQPHWDDTGVTIAMILIASGLICFISPKKPFIVALAVGAWIPLFGVLKDGNYGTLLALVFGFVGAYLGSLTRKALAF